MQNRPKQTGPLVDEKSSDHDILAELLRINRQTLQYVVYVTILNTALVVAVIILILTR